MISSYTAGTGAFQADSNPGRTGFLSDVTFEFILCPWNHRVHMEVSMAMGVPQNGWFIREHPIKMDDWGVPLFQETTIFLSSSTHGVSLHLVWLAWQ